MIANDTGLLCQEDEQVKALTKIIFLPTAQRKCPTCKRSLKVSISLTLRLLFIYSVKSPENSQVALKTQHQDCVHSPI